MTPEEIALEKRKVAASEAAWKTTMLTNRQVVTVEVAAFALDVEIAYIYKLINDGKLYANSISQKVKYVNVADIDNYMRGIDPRKEAVEVKPKKARQLKCYGRGVV